jgi:small subunit ribosomal protein S13
MEQKQTQQKSTERVVRILSKDIEGKTTLYSGLTKIKGVSWGLSNAVCHILKIDKTKKIGELSPEEIKKIEEFIKNPDVPIFLMNRRGDLETGEDKHLQGTNLELRKDFDIKRLKQIRSYRGLRHSLGQPVRGQRTKAHFRTNRRKGSGIKRKAQKTEKPYEGGKK